MKYYEVKFTLSPYNSDVADVLASMAGEVGFESFEDTDDGMKGYVQQQLFDRGQLDDMLQAFPLPTTTITYTIAEAEDRNWNEQWEQEGFDPIFVDDRLVIHDGRHLPSSDFPGMKVEIDAHMAFGTGTHETTRMVCSTLLDLFAKSSSTPYTPRVLDCGCGTGILGIVTMLLGARECTAYDIDEWSVDNTSHNAVINQVELTPLQGDASILNNVEGTFDLIMANINRNILLADMPAFRQKMAPGAHLILSGFYTEDIPLLTEKATTLGLSLVAQREEHGWSCIVLIL